MSLGPIVISTYFAVHRDAVGNDVQIQEAVLREAGYQVYIYAEKYDDFFSKKVCSYEKALSILKDPDSLLILHHSCYMPQLEDLLSAARGRVAVKYHNITPAEYFGHSPRAQKELQLGRLQTEYLVRSRKVTSFWGDSSYNNAEIMALGASAAQCQTLAPFHFVEDFREAGTNSKLESHLRDGRFNVLFVGRLMLHKGQLAMIDVIDHYLAMYDRNIRLLLVGRLENPGYGKQLTDAVNSRRLSSYIEIHQDVNFRDLHTFYQNSQSFLLMSEHEGFGVPILEAQYHNLPIVALDRAAVRETLGADQLVLEDSDPAVFAAALHRLKADAALRDHIAQKGQENYQQYSRARLAQRFLGLIKSMPVP